MSIIIPANSAVGGGFDVDNSLRFEWADAGNLNKTLGTATNRKKFTISTWVKRSDLYTNGASRSNYVIAAGTSANTNVDELYFRFDTIDFSAYESSSTKFQLRSDAVFRDVAAWYHLVIAFDSTQGTSSNRIKIYVNNVQITDWDIETYPSQNLEPLFNKNVQHMIGRVLDGAKYYGGYMSEFVFIDGQQLDPTSFGEFDEDSGTWKPISVSGLTFGNNGFYLEFKDSSALGADTSGNSNNFTVVNIAATDQSTDTCTNNFATLNFLNNRATLTQGSLQMLTSGGNKFGSSSTIQVSQGKWFCELKYVSETGAKEAIFGITSAASENNRTDNDYVSPYAYGYYTDNGSIYNNNGATSYGSSVSIGDIVGIALDLTNNKLYFAINGTWQNSANPATNSNGFSITAVGSGTPEGGYAFYGGDISTTGSRQATLSFNFGSPAFAISSGNADADGYGNFEYAVPSGYFALNTKNLAEYG
tara:strand:+ start:304 stop:1728 length:1425 start_codon:yes stop_codon:yes gene_type:complete